jgi:hypothetical protein
MWHVWRRRDMHTRFWSGSLKENNYLGDWDNHVKTDLKEKWQESMGWIHLVQDTDK